MAGRDRGNLFGKSIERDMCLALTFFVPVDPLTKGLLKIWSAVATAGICLLCRGFVRRLYFRGYNSCRIFAAEMALVTVPSPQIAAIR